MSEPSSVGTGRKYTCGTTLVLLVAVVLAGTPYGCGPAPDPGDLYEPTAAVGRLHGQLSVDADGNAQYRVPINVPPGRRGLQPQLALQYSSGDGDGLLGVGWSLKGISAIRLCSRTLAVDGYRQAVTMTEDVDAFCLDGARLVFVATIPDGDEWRTEHETFARIRRHVLGGNTTFTVESRDGRILTYGGSAESRSQTDVVGSHPVAWYLSQERDRTGNTVEYNYDALAAPSAPAGSTPLAEVELSSIQYTGFVGPGGLSRGDRFVRLVYERRPDIHDAFRQSVRSVVTQRLRAIRTEVAGVLQQEYRLEYDSSGATGNSRLTSITLCANAPSVTGRPGPTCLPPTRFTWQTSDVPVASAFDRIDKPDWNLRIRASAAVASVPPAHETQSFTHLDLNGDGAEDFAFLDGDTDARHPDRSHVAVLLGEPVVSFGGSAAPFTTRIDTTPGSIIPEEGDGLVRADWDTDGLDDLLFVERTTERVLVLRSTGRDFELLDTGVRALHPHPSILWPADTEFRYYFMALDMDGDGRSDLVSCNAGAPCLLGDPESACTCELTVAWRDDAGYGPWTRSGQRADYLRGGGFSVPDRTPAAGDFDGNGVNDLLTFPHGSGERGIFVADSERRFGTLPTSLADWQELDSPMPLDVNGDGVSDVVGSRPSRWGFSEDSTITFFSPFAPPFDTTSFEVDPDVGVFANHWHWVTNTPVLWRSYGGARISTEAEPFENARTLHAALTDVGRPYLLANKQSGPQSVLTPRVYTRRSTDLNGDGRGDLLEPLVPDAGRSGTDVPFVGAAGTVYRIPDAPISVFEATPSGVSSRAVTSAVMFVPVLDSHHIQPWSDTQWATMDVDADGDLDIVSWEVFLDFEDARGAPIGMRGRPRFATFINQRAVHNLVTRIEDGFGDYKAIDYTPMSDPLTYTPARDCVYPVQCAVGSRPLVRAVRSFNGLTGVPTSTAENVVSYHYEDGRIDRRGRGWLGFARRTVYDVRHDATTVETFDNRTYVETHPGGGSTAERFYPFTGLPQTTVVYDAAPVEAGLHASLRVQGSITHHMYDYIISTSATPGSERAYFVRERQVIEESHEGMTPAPPGTADLGRYLAVQSLVKSTQTDRDFDDYGNVIRDRLLFADGSVDLVTNEYDNDPGPWLLGLPRSETAQYLPSTGGNDCGTTDTVTFEVDGVTGLLSATHQNAGDVAASLDVNVGRDIYGNVVSERSSSTVRTTTSTVVYDPSGYFPVTIQDTLGHRSELHMHRALGSVAWIVDPNGLRTEFGYDGFGRRVRSAFPDGSSSRTEFTFTTSPVITTFRNDELIGSTTLDRVGRIYDQRWPVYDAARPGGESFVHRIARYDALGRISTASQPVPTGRSPSPGETLRFRYDGLERLRQRSDGSGTIERWFSARQTTERNPRGLEYTLRYDLRGELLTQDEPASTATMDGGGRTTFSWCDPGRLRELHDAHGNVTRVHYDSHGRRVEFDDPDRGATSYAYDGFGDLQQMIDALGRTTAYERDPLGRILRETRPEGETLYSYDSALNGIGKLALVSNGPTTTSYNYDTLSRVTAVHEDVEGERYALRTEYYDSGPDIGRISSIQYPTAFHELPFEARFAYASTGDVSAITRSDGSTIWSLDRVSPGGGTEQESFGNGVTTTRQFDPGTGDVTRIASVLTSGSAAHELMALSYGYDGDHNVASRQDEVHAYREDYLYDAVDRLRQITATNQAGGLPSVTSLHYDEIGNMRAASDRTGLGYGESDPAGTLLHPHALTHIDSQSLHYDDVGNLLSDASRTITWTSFDLPDSVTTVGGSTTYTYDSFLSRVRETHSDGSARDSVFGLFERELDGKIGTRETYFVKARGHVVAEVIRTPTATGIADETVYTHVDALGSPEVVTNHDASLVARSSFDAWGQRRDMPWTTPDSALATMGLRVGFTGHRPDRETGFVNMGGRIYDAYFRHFASADPIAANPGQGLNRYAYVSSNPLTYSDPSGFNTDPDYSATDPWATSDDLAQMVNDDVQSGDDVSFINFDDTVTENTSGNAAPIVMLNGDERVAEAIGSAGIGDQSDPSVDSAHTDVLLPDGVTRAPLFDDLGLNPTLTEADRAAIRRVQLDSYRQLEDTAWAQQGALEGAYDAGTLGLYSPIHDHGVLDGTLSWLRAILTGGKGGLEEFAQASPGPGHHETREEELWRSRNSARGTSALFFGAAIGGGLAGPGFGPSPPIVEDAAGGGGGAARSFFDGTRYTPKVLQQMSRGPGEFHSFPESVTTFESAGTVRTITGGDGVVRQMLEIPGSYTTVRGTVMDGVFQFIKEPDGAINHRLFVPRAP